MKTRVLLGPIISIAATLLSGCGRSTMPVIAPGGATSATAGHHQVFDYTGSEQAFIVPAGVHRLTVIARGGTGGGAASGGSGDYDVPGLPGRVYAVIPVRPGQKLYVFVGGSGEHDGFNGGGAAGGAYHQGNAGGGASDVRSDGDALKDRIVVAAGGGGAGDCNIYCNSFGGSGGGLTGGAGGGYGSEGGGGATQSKGGAGGTQGKRGGGGSGGNGKLGSGGNGGDGNTTDGLGGAGGGGGYYGGGGGAGAPGKGNSGGGGGGSSYVEPSAIKSMMWTGWRETGDGRVIISWS
ncbi:MAG TPA: glycine-rich protein [Candidatus Cybelea sp.]|nr:glycine-rich protein [Candidatus Cybelea sp.]